MDYQYIEDFKNLGFGLFVHFGLYSLLGKGEWYLKNNPKAKWDDYKPLPSKFKVAKNWAKQLVSTAKSAGCKYITLTTRHHDGFSLYDTCGLNEYDAPHSASKRDLVREFVEECNKQGIVPFFYHTLLDWHEESYKNDFAKYIDYLVKSVEILCTKYGKIGGLWFDGFWDKPDADWQFDRLYSTIRKYQPTAMIINNTGLNALGQVSHKEIDSVTFERGNPCFVDNSDRPRAGEMCEGITDHWGYVKDDICFKSVPHLIDTLITCKKCNCNLLLNAGPMGNGILTPIEKYSLMCVGKWIRKNKNFIYRIGATDIKADNAIIVKDNKHYYAIMKNILMWANVNVARVGDVTKVCIFTDKKIKNAKWLDDGSTQKIEDGKFEAKFFDYGTSLYARVLKFDIVD